MPKKVPLAVVKKQTKTGRKGAQSGNGSALKSGIWADLSLKSIDGRTVLGRALKVIQGELTSALGGDLSPQQQILVEKTAYLTIRCSLFEIHSIREILSGRQTGTADPHYLAWIGQLRLTLQTLGLSRVPKNVTSLSEYLATYSQASEPEASGQGPAEESAPAAGQSEMEGQL